MYGTGQLQAQETRSRQKAEGQQSPWTRGRLEWLTASGGPDWALSGAASNESCSITQALFSAAHPHQGPPPLHVVAVVCGSPSEPVSVACHMWNCSADAAAVCAPTHTPGPRLLPIATLSARPIQYDTTQAVSVPCDVLTVDTSQTYGVPATRVTPVTRRRRASRQPPGARPHYTESPRLTKTDSPLAHQLSSSSPERASPDPSDCPATS